MGLPVADLYREHGFACAAFYKRRSKYGGMDVPGARRLRALEAESGKLRKRLPETHLDMEVLKVAFAVKGSSRR